MTGEGTQIIFWCIVWPETPTPGISLLPKMTDLFFLILPFRIRRATSVPLGKGTKFALHHGKMSTTKHRAIQILHISMFQFTFKCGYNNFISKYTDINSLHVTQIDFLHNGTFCSTWFARFRWKKGSLPVNSVMILVVLLTHVELASATPQGRSYWETGQLILFLHIVIHFWGFSSSKVTDFTIFFAK